MDKKIVPLLLLGCLLGYLLIFLSESNTLSEGATVCLFRNIYGIPCPACGSVHGVIALLSGEFSEAMGCNPNSYLLALIMVFIPICATYDIISGRDLLYNSYKKISDLIKKPLFLIAILTAETGIWGYKLAEHFGWL